MLGSDDLEAPSAETAQRIKSLIAQGKSYTLAVYPGAGHGMTEYELNAKGQRVSTLHPRRAYYAPCPHSAIRIGRTIGRNSGGTRSISCSS